MTLGHLFSITDWARERQRSLQKSRKRVKKIPSHKTELRRLCRTLMPRYVKEHPYLKSNPPYSNYLFRQWVREQPEYRDFVRDMKEKGVGIPGRRREEAVE